MLSNHDELKRRWYQEPMVLMVIAIPATAVVVSMAFLTAAIVSWDGLVVDDYYKQGKEINKRLARDQHAAQLGLGATLHSEAGSEILTLTISAKDNAEQSLGPSVRVNYVHRTRQGFDREFVVEQIASGVYTGTGEVPHSGLWSIHIEAPHWRLTAKRQLPIAGAIVFTSNKG